MELVPPNSKKTTKYTGSAQYIKNGKVSQRSSNHLFLRHYAGERFSQVSSLKWSTTNSNALSSLVLHLVHCPNHHVLLVVVQVVDNVFSLLKHFSNAVRHGLVNLGLRAVTDFLKQDLSNLEIAVQPKVSRGEIRAVGRPIISSPASSRHHSVPKDVGQKVHGSIAGMQCGAIQENLVFC